MSIDTRSNRGLEDVDSFIASLPQKADNFVAFCHDIADIDLDYTPESIFNLDSLISQLWSSEPPYWEEGIVLLVGAYMGETIRKTHGGTWQYNEGDGITLSTINNTNYSFSPFDKIRDRLNIQDPKLLNSYYRELLRILELENKLK